uniref:Uncharacterized protein n=1 Tax=Amphimedon queenslandica TaxID=400682 RepID=A0A1X7T256_AMPQE
TTHPPTISTTPSPTNTPTSDGNNQTKLYFIIHYTSVDKSSTKIVIAVSVILGIAVLGLVI